jgi:3-methyladenine DNA glycosylase AlkD
MINSLKSEFEAAIKSGRVPEISKRLRKLWDSYSDNAAVLHRFIIHEWRTDAAREQWQTRFGLVLLAGPVGTLVAESLRFLRRVCSLDEDWRVQEGLAKAFDWFCAVRGYQQSQSIIAEWLRDSNPNVRRAATEGLRVWTKRPFFAEHPEKAIKLLCLVRNDPSTYVKKSVANALSDISKYHPELVKDTLARWSKDATKDGQWIIKHAQRHLKNREE